MSGEKLAQRSYYGKALAKLAETHPDVVVFDADLAGSTKTSSFQSAAPERFVQTGIAESNMIGVAAGMAASGKVAFASTFGVFASGRCWEQIRMAVAYPRLNVKIVATHCGLSVGPDGATHQALEDIAIMRALPNMTVVVPCDAHEAYAATLALADHQGPAYMRMGRSEFPVIKEAGCGFTIGKADTVRGGKDVSIIACGQMVQTSLEAAALLALFAVLLAVYLKTRRHTTGIYLVGYAAIRFGLEFLRGDPRAAFCGLSIGQLISIGTALAGAAFLAYGERTRDNR